MSRGGQGTINLWDLFPQDAVEAGNLTQLERVLDQFLKERSIGSIE